MTPFRSETPEDLIAPACRPTVDRLQLVLDGELEANAIDTDPHPAVCAACRERIAAARLVLSVLGATEAVAVPSGLTERIVSAVREDRDSRIRRRSYAAALGIPVALAASLALIAWFTDKPQQPIAWNPQVPVEKNPEVAPAPREVAQVKPLRIGDELTKAGIALRETPKAITAPASAAPEVFAKLTNALTQPIAPMPDEMEPARSALAELPDVALSGLEPLTDTAQKAFSRLMRDVGSVSVKPKS
ncbi:MAG: hypothetical protein C0467_04400 [Planctomycetaceae bacterium]|nr:hypothetical protein [Planctomycetaceae bacterium]